MMSKFKDAFEVLSYLGRGMEGAVERSLKDESINVFRRIGQATVAKANSEAIDYFLPILATVESAVKNKDKRQEILNELMNSLEKED